MLVKRRKFGLDIWDLAQTVAVALIGAVPGSKLLNAAYKLIEWKLIGETGNFKAAWNEGSCFYGALIGAALTVYLLAKSRKLPFGKLTGILTYFVSASCVIGRIGCWYAGCCFGKMMPGGWRFPSQFVEAGYCAFILLFYLIAQMERRNIDTMFPLFVLLYSLGRAILEFYRAGTTRVGVISMTQWVAFALIVVSAVWLISEGIPRKIPQKNDFPP